ncbi:MAG: hypothetical protein AB1546_11765 [bacterium]
MATQVSAAGVGSVPVTTHSTIGRQVSILQATLVENAKQQEIARRPLKVPDLRQFGVGTLINITV